MDWQNSTKFYRFTGFCCFAIIKKERVIMKCLNCGTEYEGNLCPNCGSSQEQQTTTQTTQQPNDRQFQPQIIINNNVNQSDGGYRPGTSNKSKVAALILAIFLGAIGIHRFYVGKVGTGIIWFLTGGCFLIGWIYDIIKIASGTFKDGAGLIIK